MLNNYRALCVLVEAKNTNPQGNPDEDNRPRTNPYTNHGFITSVGLKRKVRDFLNLNSDEVYVARNVCLQDVRADLINKQGLSTALLGEDDEEPESIEGEEEAPKKGAKKKSKAKATPEDIDSLYSAVTKKFIDVRLFGQLIPKFGKALRGPIQVSDGVSIDPIDVVDIAMTRVAVETAKESEDQGNRNQTMASKSVVSYGLYRFDIFVNPHDSIRSGCSEEDYEKFVQALLKCWQNDCSSARILSIKAVHELTFNKTGVDGKVTAAPMQHFINQVNVAKKDSDTTPTSFEDYEVTLGKDLVAAVASGSVTHKDRLREMIDSVIG
jgi:CRISPR-associated protein Csd2